jgi:hypothetical protein
MKKAFLEFICLILFHPQSGAQVDTLVRSHLYAGVGYFADIIQFIDPGFNAPDFVKVNPKVEGKIFNGKSIWFQYGYNLKTGFIASLDCSMASTRYPMNDPAGLFWDTYRTDSYLIVALALSKEFNIKNSFISFGTGLLYRNYNSQDIDYSINPIYNSENVLTGVQLGLPCPSNSKMDDLGIVFDLKYHYKFKNNFIVGLSCSSNLIFDIGFETVSISPFIGYVF